MFKLLQSCSRQYYKIELKDILSKKLYTQFVSTMNLFINRGTFKLHVWV